MTSCVNKEKGQPHAKHHFCAGILPFCYFNQSLYFLLGRSKRSSRLLTFTGKNDPGEEPRDTAVREGYEETLGAVISKEFLRAKISACTESHILLSATPRGTACYTYLVEIPYRRYYNTCFQNTKEFLSSICALQHQFEEMLELKWVCSSTMITKMRPIWRKGGITVADEEWMKLQALARVESNDVSNWRKRRIEEPSHNEDHVVESGRDEATP